MPSFILAALAFAISVPRAILWAAIALQAVLCWPQIIDLRERYYAFRLHGFPLAAALRIESEPDYLRRHTAEWNVVQMIERSTLAGSRTLALGTVASAYLDRDVEVSWQSAEGDRLLDSLRLAGLYSLAPAFDWRAEWPAQPVRAVRFVFPRALDGEWDISEIQLFSGDYRVFNSPQWTFGGRPNPWEGALAFDGNPATRWRTWEPVRAGTSFEVHLANPQRLTGALLLSHVDVAPEVYGQDPKGAWHMLTKDAHATARPAQDLRLDAARALRTAGFRYLLAPAGDGGNAPIGNVITGHEAEWGMEQVGYAGDYHLFRVK